MSSVFYLCLLRDFFQVLTQERLARDKLVAARKVNADTKADLMEKQARKSRLQADLQAKGRQLGLAAAKIKEVNVHTCCHCHCLPALAYGRGWRILILSVVNVL